MKTADFLGDAVDDGVDEREGFVFAEWDEVNFVVGKNAMAVIIVALLKGTTAVRAVIWAVSGLAFHSMMPAIMG